MKIATISLRNFRSSQNLTLDTAAPRVYICGLNGAGKSSIRDAIRWTLRGVCSGTDAKGLGWEHLAPEGTTIVASGLNIIGVGAVERSRKAGAHTLQIEDRPNEISAVQTAIYQLLGVSPEVIDAVLETEYFLRLHHADAKAMVLGLLNVKIPIEGREMTLDQVEAAYKAVFSDRTVAKAKLKAHSVPLFKVPAEGEYPPVADIRGKLEGLRDELKGLSKQADTTAGKRQLLAAQLEAAQARTVEVVPMRVSSADEIAALAKELADMEAEADRVTKAYQVAQQALKSGKRAPALPASLAEVEERMRILTDHKPTAGCVLDPNVECRTPKIIFTNHVKELRASAKDMAGPAEPTPEPEKPVIDLQAIASTRERLRLARQNVEAIDRATRVNTTRQDEIDALGAQIASLGPAPASSTEDPQVETLKARIAKGDKVLTAATDYWNQHAAHAAAVKTEQALKAEVARLEEGVEILGPNGARVGALKAAIGAFETAINATTQAFGYAVAFDLDPWRVLVNGRPAQTYSESEQFRIGIAIQIAVAASSGLGFLVVDRLDMLTLENRGLITKMLMQEILGIEQIVILASREPGQALPALEGVKAYRLARPDARTEIAEVA